MLLGFVEVLLLRIFSSWNLLYITSTCTNSVMGTFVKREESAKLTTSSLQLSFTPVMISTKCLLFLTNESMKPARGEYELGNMFGKLMGGGVDVRDNWFKWDSLHMDLGKPKDPWGLTTGGL